MRTRWGNRQRTVLWLSLLWPLGSAALEVPPTLLQILPPEPLVQSTLQESLALQSASAGVDRALAEAALRRRGPHEASVNAEWLRRDVDQEGRFGEDDSANGTSACPRRFAGLTSAPSIRRPRRA